MFLLVSAYPGCPGSKAVKRSSLLLLLLLQGFELLASCDSLKYHISTSSFDSNTSTMVKIVILIVIVLHGSVVVQLRCSGYIVYR